MGNFYIFMNGTIMSAGFETQEAAEEYAREGGFQGAFIIQIISKVD